MELLQISLPVRRVPSIRKELDLDDIVAGLIPSDKGLIVELPACFPRIGRYREWFMRYLQKQMNERLRDKTLYVEQVEAQNGRYLFKLTYLH
jgi:hypothetical protein